MILVHAYIIYLDLFISINDLCFVFISIYCSKRCACIDLACDKVTGTSKLEGDCHG